MTNLSGQKVLQFLCVLIEFPTRFCTNPKNFFPSFHFPGLFFLVVAWFHLAAQTFLERWGVLSKWHADVFLFQKEIFSSFSVNSENLVLRSFFFVLFILFQLKKLKSKTAALSQYLLKPYGKGWRRPQIVLLRKEKLSGVRNFVQKKNKQIFVALLKRKKNTLKIWLEI